ncbi:MAG: class I SAM-dependent rRNA methyltransferase [Bdellovibrionales bacterium]
MALPIIRLQAQRHRRALGGHPWIYSNEVVMDEAAKAFEPGALAEFRSHDGRFIGKGSFDPHPLIAGRIFSRNLVEAIDEAWLLSRVREALELRERLVSVPFYRVIHAEADGIPGLIVDRFGEFLAVQLNTSGIERLWPELRQALMSLLKPRGIYVQKFANAQRFVEGEAADGPVEVSENGLTFYADLAGGQKTGWYFDQRDNHALVARYVRSQDNALDLYTHAGGFALHAARAGAAQVVAVDSSEPALQLAQTAAERGGYAAQCKFVRADVFEELERRSAAKEKFKIVVADPPAFVKSRKDLTSGGKGYRKLARLCAQVTAQQGILFIASCSHNMDLPGFTEQVAAGLAEAGREGRILHTVFAAPDHPVHPHLPESAYLKALLVRLD